MVSDSMVYNFESVRVVIRHDQDNEQEQVVTFARLPKEITGYTEVLSDLRDDEYIHWYTRFDEWGQIANAQLGDELPCGCVLVRFAKAGE